MIEIRLSKSKVDTYLQCPKKYDYQFVQELETEPQPQLELGKNMHKKYEVFYKSLPETVDEEAIKSGLAFAFANATMEERHHLDNFLHMNLQMFANLKAMEMPEAYKPILIEEKYFDEELNYSGVIDAVFKFGDDVVILDWKTSNYRRGKEADYEFGMQGYRKLFDTFNPDMTATHWAIGFTGTGNILVEKNNPAGIAKFTNTLAQTRKAIAEKAFEKKPSVLCQWCGYYSRCWC